MSFSEHGAGSASIRCGKNKDVFKNKRWCQVQISKGEKQCGGLNLVNWPILIF